MGTNNFHNENASRYFALLMAYEQPILDEDDIETGETETVYPDTWEVEDTIDAIRETMMHRYPKMYVSGGNDPHELRSYPSRVLGRLYKSKYTMQTDFEVEITAVCRSGYYDGCNLDWHIDFKIDGYERDVEDLEEIEAFLAYNSQNNGMAKIQARNIQKWAENAKEGLIDKLEAIFAEYSDCQLKKVGQFSNGEAVYQKV